MANWIINGVFLNNNVTGIERFAIGMTKHLDSFTKKGELTLVLPPNAKKDTLVLRNIKIRQLPQTPFKPLKNLKLAIYMILHHCNCIDYTNHIPFFGENIVFLHDIYCKSHPQDFITKDDKKIMKSTCKMYERICKKAKIICTVSEYSKSQIMKYYGVSSEKILVIYDGADYMPQITADVSILKQYPQLKQKNFYFTLGSLSLRKNLKWIADHAELYPNEQFVISGTALKNVVPKELEKLQTLPNIILAGYLSDEQIKALYENCKAFVFPSYFEGFGLPPLEALQCGAQIIIAKASCLPEIYGDCAHYIDPNNPNVDLDALLSEPVLPPDALFKKYSLDNSAKKLYDLIKI